MSTMTLTTAQLTLIKRTDVTSNHLLIVARGRQLGRRFSVPEGRAVGDYRDGTPNLDVNVGTVSLVLRGRLQSQKMHTAGARIIDYMLTPAEADPSRVATARHPDSQWHRHVEQSGKSAGAKCPLEVASLGAGVSCDIVRLRHQPIALRLNRKLPRLSQLLKDGLLTQYTFIHCLFSRTGQYDPPVSESVIVHAGNRS